MTIYRVETIRQRPFRGYVPRFTKVKKFAPGHVYRVEGAKPSPAFYTGGALELLPAPDDKYLYVYCNTGAVLSFIPPDKLSAALNALSKRHG